MPLATEESRALNMISFFIFSPICSLTHTRIIGIEKKYALKLLLLINNSDIEHTPTTHGIRHESHEPCSCKIFLPEGPSFKKGGSFGYSESVIVIVCVFVFVSECVNF